MKKNFLMPLKLQFFAGEGEGDGEGEAQTQQQQETNKEVDTEKIKSDAVAEYLKSLGVESDDALKGIITKHNDDIKKGKTDLENKQDELNTATTELAKEREARIKAEAKAEAMILGADPKMVEDLIIVAMARVTKDKDVKQVLAEMKNGENASNYFVTEKEEEKKETKVTRKRVTKTESSKKESKEDEKHEGSMAERFLAKRKQPKSHYFK